MQPTEAELEAMRRTPPPPTKEQVLIAKAKNLRAIVEADPSRRWVDANQPGMRLKDSPQWAEFYSALAKFNL